MDSEKSHLNLERGLIPSTTIHQLTAGTVRALLKHLMNLLQNQKEREVMYRGAN